MVKMVHQVRNFCVGGSQKKIMYTYVDVKGLRSEIYFLNITFVREFKIISGNKLDVSVWYFLFYQQINHDSCTTLTAPCFRPSAPGFTQ